MSGFGTKKPGGDVAIELTFPAVFSEVASRGHLNSAYYPEPASRPMVLARDNDLQGNYHQKKMEDAHRMAMAKVQSTKMAEQRYLNSHAGYFGMPKVVLGQRKYANPSYGNQADIYSNRPVWDSVYQPTSGGVLYTAEAQKWGRNKLKGRIAQLNAIDVAKQGLVSQYLPQGLPQGMPQGMPSVQMRPQMEAEPASAKLNIELVQLLQSVSDSVEAGSVGQFAFNDVIKLLRLLFRWATSADTEELKEVYEYVDRNQQLLDGMEDMAEEGADANGKWVKDIAPNLGTVSDIFRRLRKYMDGMIASVNKSPSERRAVSANLVKTLGFTRVRNAPQSSEMKKSPVFSEPNPYESIASASEPESSRGKTFWESLYSSSGKNEAKFDPSVREEMGADNGAFEGEELPDTYQQGVSNAFRNLSDIAESNPYEDESESDIEDRLRKFFSSSEAASEAATSSMAPAISNKSQPISNKSQPFSETYGTRAELRKIVNESDAVQMMKIARKLREEGKGDYDPLPSSKRTSIKSGLIKAYGL